MSAQFEDEILGRAYDSRLMRRMLRYARPFTGLIALTVFLLLLVTVADLSRPYIIKVAIDSHLNAGDIPYVVYPAGTPLPARHLRWQGMTVAREDWLSPQESHLSAGLRRIQVLSWHGHAYQVDGAIPRQAEFRIEGGYVLAKGGRRLPAHPLPPGAAGELRRGDGRAVVQLAWLYVLIIALSFLLNYAQTYLLNYTGQKIIYSLRQEIFAHQLKLSLSFFDRTPVGRLVTRVTNDAEALNDMYTNVLVYLFKDVFLLAGVVLVMFRLNVELALISLAVLPLIVLATVQFRRQARNAYRLVRVRLARINATLAENLAGMRVIQVFHQEERNFRDFAAINQDYYQATMLELKVFAIFRPIMDLLSSLALSLLLWYGGLRALGGHLELGVLFAFVSYIGQFFGPINDLADKYNIMQSAMAAAERIFQLLDTHEFIPDRAAAGAGESPAPAVAAAAGRARRAQGAIEFRHVWFAYRGEDWVLRDINFRVEPGQTVAFVGATGAGKTSIISLLNRLYDIQKGEILLDGRDIREWPLKELRRQVAVVMQDVFLFTGDIASNIRLNNREITDQQLEEAARQVHADEFIQRLPGGYHAPVEERGATLSAGQRQLLAFARALAFDPPVLVLDEATANIDTETEQLIQQALHRLTENRTTLVIAHRLSTIQHADQILVIHKGRLREQGTHQELLAKRGLYYRLYQLQYENGTEGSGAQGAGTAAAGGAAGRQ
ncbi:MAG: ABC transporter ATP-binding protein [Firmicutes bacterium]|nr:ABC transporter ATP-binding protein [Bacillota bacterium]